MSDFLPIVFHKDFTLRKYHSWRCLSESPSLHHLEQVQGMFRRHLILFFGADESRVQDALQEKKDQLESASEIRIYIFPAPVSAPASISWNGRTLLQAKGDDRMFNTNTIVHDLARSEEEHWNAFNTLTKRVCKQAIKDGIEARITENPDGTVIRNFLKNHSKMASERGLRHLPEKVLEKMSSDGTLISVESRDRNQKLGTTLLIYKCNPYAIYLYGASDPEAKTQLGQFLQWEAIKYLKRTGLRWYDLGGVPSTNEENGIYRFKKALGGMLVGPSVEYLYQGQAFRAAKWLKQRLHL